jgi:hypothetical protein
MTRWKGCSLYWPVEPERWPPFRHFLCFFTREKLLSSRSPKLAERQTSIARAALRGAELRAAWRACGNALPTHKPTHPAGRLCGSLRASRKAARSAAYGRLTAACTFHFLTPKSGAKSAGTTLRADPLKDSLAKQSEDSLRSPDCFRLRRRPLRPSGGPSPTLRCRIIFLPDAGCH